ncbi:YdeI/OmpD-associated family protein [Isoptericola sp. AK164]|uniref:YdeI/OmpD-associated family protein n=1 Tax=Isoptericola sp. AK164 TaxID=3024246 RepID=UPI00241816A8|nr:YdeI/OmpD-associated family protein [Isoptericola sp. AK164]
MATEPTDPLILPDASAWRAWLDDHEDTATDGVWVVLARKGRPGPTGLTRDLALEEALCSGWIDAQSRRRDEDTSLQRYCPRRRRSAWSVRNREIADRLVAEGRMRPRGQAEIDRAHQDGRWDAAYGGAVTIEVPAVLADALAASPRAAVAWERLSAQNRSTILHRLSTARREETRARHAARFVAMLERGETPHPQRRSVLPDD